MNTIVDDFYGKDMFGKPVFASPDSVVKQRFLLPPFTVLDTKSGAWQERKRAWLKTGIDSEVGRDAKTFNLAGVGGIDTDTSVFDPVLCEMAYMWFSCAGARVLDPFAGGSVRGIVAASLGRDYTGVELRPEQVSANNDQANLILDEHRPTWIHGDAMDVVDMDGQFDFVFSCPPYGNLEVYSDNPADLSTMEWHTFSSAYKRIVLRCVKAMRNDRFACFVVGNFRDNRGFYRDLVGLTVSAFEECGARFYNDAVLLNTIGTAAMRVGAQFTASRKLCKVHQNVLVFCKGDPRKATAYCGAVL